jgi:hypothetical protein
MLHSKTVPPTPGKEIPEIQVLSKDWLGAVYLSNEFHGVLYSGQE